MRRGVRGAVTMRLAGAVLLGVATLLVPKADATEHWAVPPRAGVVEIMVDVGDRDPLDPPSATRPLTGTTRGDGSP